MTDPTTKRSLRCAIYTRVSTDQGLEQDFNSLDPQREASEAYIKSQAHEGWRPIRDHYDDGGYSGGSMDRPALQKLLADVDARRVDVIVVYKVAFPTAQRVTSSGATESAGDLRTAIERVVISRTTIEIELSESIAGEDRDHILMIPWTPPSPYRRREIINGEDDQFHAMRPMRTEACATLIDALRDAQRWLQELTISSDQTIEALAVRESKTERSIRMTLSLNFLSPALVKAAIERRLPRGFGLTRLMDLPIVWSDQWAALGLKASTQA